MDIFAEMNLAVLLEHHQLMQLLLPSPPPAPTFRVQGSGFRVQGSGFRVLTLDKQGNALPRCPNVQGPGCRVQGSRLSLPCLGAVD